MQVQQSISDVIKYTSLLTRLASPQSHSQQVTQFFGTSSGLCVAYSPEQQLWVAGGNGPSGSLAYSTDGIEWVPASFPFFIACSGVAYGNGKWIAVGYGSLGSIAYSTNGRDWQPVTTNNFFDNGYGVAYGNGKWVAVGSGVNGTIAYSSDGLVWQPSTNFFGAGAGYGIAFSPDFQQWVAVGGGPNGNICYSNDGIVFILSDVFFGAGVGYGVAYGQGRWIAVGMNTIGTQSVGYSTNTVNWSPLPNFFENGTGKGVAFDGVSRWVITGFGYNGSIGYSTDAGQTWTTASRLFEGGPGGASVAYASSSGVWIAVGSSFVNTVLYSPDGVVFSTKAGVDASGIAPFYMSLLPLLRESQ